MMIEGKKFYRIAEACRMSGISKTTLNRWIKAGIIPPATHKDRHGWRLFTQKEIDQIKSEVNKIHVS